MQPISFSLRTSTAIAVFSCIFVASPMQGARQFTSDVPTVTALQLRYAELINLYPQLVHQDVANQRVVLYGLIAQALTIVSSLNTTVQGMSATGDQGVQLKIMQGIVQSALASLNAVTSDEK